MTINLIWAQASNGVIGIDNQLPWHLPEDLTHFKELTAGAAVIMGRKTWESLPPRFRPLPGRRNIVLTRDETFEASGALVAHTPLGAVLAAHGDPIWVIGGSQVYRQFIGHADRLEVTEMLGEFDGDAHAPEITGNWAETSSTVFQSASGIPYRFRSLSKPA